MDGWRVRRARWGEASRLTEIAHAAKRHWGYPEHWIEAWKKDLTVTSDTLSQQLVLVACSAFQARRLGAFCALRAAAEDPWSLEHMWVSPEHMGRGLGKMLWERALESAKQGGATTIEIVSDPNAAGFYERLGAHLVGQHQGDPLDGRARELPVYLYEI